jgi:hypothetical protein
VCLVVVPEYKFDPSNRNGSSLVDIHKVPGGLEVSATSDTVQISCLILCNMVPKTNHKIMNQKPEFQLLTLYALSLLSSQPAKFRH